MISVRQKSCFFIGHRETPEEIYPVLCATVEEHIVRYGVTEFIVGHYGCFDGFAAKAVKTAKQAHPEVGLTLLLPYHPAERPIPVPDGFDSTYYPPGMENVPPHCLCAAPCQQCKRSSRICKKREGRGLIHVTALPHNDL